MFSNRWDKHKYRESIFWTSRTSTCIQIGAGQSRSRAARSRRASAGKACERATQAESRAVRPPASRV